MSNKTHTDLERAKELFYTSRYLEAYAILRRYYDRLPFAQEEGHAEYIGIFVRVLTELGKKNELKFYTGILESLYDKTNNPELAFQLAFVYLESNPPKTKLARMLLESLVSATLPGPYIAKVKMALAYCYDEVDNDVASCRKLIFSIDSKDVEPRLQNFLKVWKAKVLRDERNYEQAEILLNEVITPDLLEDDWFTYFYAQTVRGVLLARSRKLDESQRTLQILQGLNEIKKHKTAERWISYLSEQIQSNGRVPKLEMRKRPNEIILDYAGKSISISGSSVAEKLLVHLLEKGVVDKSNIVKAAYDRSYRGKEDDQLIYYHVNGVRKILHKVGLDSNCVLNEGNGYRIVPAVVEME